MPNAIVASDNRRGANMPGPRHRAGLFNMLSFTSRIRERMISFIMWLPRVLEPLMRWPSGYQSAVSAFGSFSSLAYQLSVIALVHSPLVLAWTLTLGRQKLLHLPAGVRGRVAGSRMSQSVSVEYGGVF